MFPPLEQWIRYSDNLNTNLHRQLPKK